MPNSNRQSFAERVRRVGNPRAARVVGSIMRRNYDPAAPCHRVIKANGEPGGYNRGGPVAKQRRLQQEQESVEASIDNSRSK